MTDLIQYRKSTLMTAFNDLKMMKVINGDMIDRCPKFRVFNKEDKIRLFAEGKSRFATLASNQIQIYVNLLKADKNTKLPVKIIDKSLSYMVTNLVTINCTDFNSKLLKYDKIMITQYMKILKYLLHKKMNVQKFKDLLNRTEYGTWQKK